jgi:hypothetical protein
MSLRLRRFWIQLTADRRRFGALCLALCLGLLLWARLIVVSKPPRTALANDALAAGKASPSIDPDRSAASPEATASRGADNKVRRSGSEIVDGRAGRSPIRVELSAKPVQDPFVIDPLYFPKPTPFTDSNQHASKSQSEPVEEPLQTEARLTAQLLALVERFKLEAAIGSSIAVIDGKAYRVGNEIPSSQGRQVRFKLSEVRQRSVILECEGRRFELQMTSPGT